MDKTRLQQLILARLQADQQVAEAAVRSAHEAATHSESKAENKYDTRGLEAAYLADGQRRRLLEIERALALYRNLVVRDYDEEQGIQLGALIELEDGDGRSRRLFLGPDGAGLKIDDGDGEILLITPHAPLGQSLLGRRVGDEVETRVGEQRLYYEIIAVD
jgi:transcription elongation GreA/GreB family factor